MDQALGHGPDLHLTLGGLSPEAAINNLNSETQKSPQAMSYINIEPIEGYEESVNENTDEQGKDEEAWNKYATDEEDDFKLKN